MATSKIQAARNIETGTVASTTSYDVTYALDKVTGLVTVHAQVKGTAISGGSATVTLPTKLIPRQGEDAALSGGGYVGVRTNGELYIVTTAIWTAVSLTYFTA